MKIDGAIFDLDGTLLDSLPAWENLGENYLSGRGVAPREGLSERLRELSLEQSARLLKLEYGLPDEPEIIEKDIIRMIEDFYFHRALPKKGVPEFLAKLGGRRVKMCVATASDFYLAEAALARCGLLSYFSKIFTCGFREGSKADPAFFERVRSFLGTPRETTWVFEDAPHAMRAAKAAGLNVVGVFDPLQPRMEQAREISDVFIRSFAEIGRLF
jgi:HAD superfamily hydrolase (TIGR01509 family)